MLAVRPVPFRNARRLVHILDDLSPADSGVVRAERDLTELGRVRNNAHFSATEVVVEEVLEPHSRNKQEVPWIVAALLDVHHRSVAGNLSVTFSRQTEGLIELLHDVHQSQAWRSAERVVILEQRESHHRVGEPLASAGIGDFLHVVDKTWNIQELRYGRKLFRLLIDHHRGSDSAIRVTTATDLSPIRAGPVHEI